MPPAWADSPAPPDAGHGAVTQEMRGVRATGPRNEIDIATRANAAIPDEWWRFGSEGLSYRGGYGLSQADLVACRDWLKANFAKLAAERSHPKSGATGILTTSKGYVLLWCSSTE